MLSYYFGIIEHIVFSSIVVALVGAFLKKGFSGISEMILKFLQMLPGVKSILNSTVRKEVKGMLSAMSKDKASKEKPQVVIPEQGIPISELREEITELSEKAHKDVDGKIFAYIYTQDGDLFDLQREAFDAFNELPGVSENYDELLKDAHHAFMHENALNPIVFPHLRRFEVEVVSMTGKMLNGGNDVSGSVTSGGTESILMAMKTYRDWARDRMPHVTAPEMVAPITIHPAHEKAADYFGFKIVHVPVTSTFQVDTKAMEEAIGPNTIGLLASAPQYCHGIIDDIKTISDLAVKYSIPLHVDACFGGFMLPWVEKLGYPVEPFDFRLPGVMSMSADIHKYGFGCKGTSVVVYRNSNIRKYQLFAYSGWPGGLFGSPSMAGTRSGSNLATAWVALKAMGVSGYMKMAKELMQTADKLKSAINNDIQGLRILGAPVMTAFAIGSDDTDVDVMAVASAMERQGWKMECQQNPPSLHCSILPQHIRSSDNFITDLKLAVQQARVDPSLKKEGMAGTYGLVGIIPDGRLVDDIIKEFFNQIYS